MLLLGANNLLMLILFEYQAALFVFQAFHNQAHIINITGMIMYLFGTY